MRRMAAGLVALLVCAGAAPVPGTITVTGAGIASAVVPAEIAGWPAASVNAMFATGHGMLKAAFSGPLLWTVLCDTQAVDPTKPRALAHEFVVVTGSDGYQAVVALGELAPMFEGKKVILAATMNGKALAPGAYRLIVPGDAAGARSVRDVTRIAVLAPAGG